MSRMIRSNDATMLPALLHVYGVESVNKDFSEFSLNFVSWNVLVHFAFVY